MFLVITVRFTLVALFLVLQQFISPIWEVLLLYSDAVYLMAALDAPVQKRVGEVDPSGCWDT